MLSIHRKSMLFAAALLALAQLLTTGAVSPAAAAGDIRVDVCLKASDNTPLVPDTTHYQINGGSSFYFASDVDPTTSCKYQLFPDGTTSVTIWTSYNHTESAHVTQDITTDPVFSFQTEAVTVQVENVDSGDPVASVLIRYGADGSGGGTYYFLGTPTPSHTGSSGQLTTELFPGTYTFRVDLNFTSTTKTQDVGSDPTVVFDTATLTLGYSGTIAFGGSSGSGAGFPSSHQAEMFPGTVNFQFRFSPGPNITLPITMGAAAMTKSMIVAKVVDDTAAPVAGVAVTASPGGISLGTTDANGVAYALVDGTLGDETVSFTYGGNAYSLTQNQPTNSIYKFTVSAPAPTSTVTLTGGATGLTNVATQSVTATFSAPVSGFALGDLSLTNASASGLTGSDGDTVYIFDVTAAADGAVSVSVRDAVVTPDNTASNTLSWTYDGTPPAVNDVIANGMNPIVVSAGSALLTGVADDSSAGGSNVASAEYSVDGGAWMAMAAVDGSFDSPTETLTATLAVPTSPTVETICVRATDAAGNVSDGSACTTLVVYDPSGGFVTGGGWIMSPAGACLDTTVCVDATGKATFGFVSKYKKGASVPDGNTQFVFKAGNLSFSSTSYDWLVVNKAGSNAQYKGSGSINGAGDYGFMIWATSASPDTFRILITDKSSGATVYDNGGTELGGGSIIVHTGK